jgi:glycosyltransferase involved in cell wall biosynthesis
MSSGLVSIILPVCNQADHIAQVIEEYEGSLGSLPRAHEIIVVINGSRDRSAEVCRELIGRYASLQVLESKRGGWGLAVKLGLQAARGDLLCYTNSARTSAQDLTLLLLYAIVYPDVVIKANRKIREKLSRRVGSLLYNLQCRTLFDLSYWDINGTPKVFPRKFGKLLRLARDDDLIDAEFNIICRREQYPMVEVPIFSTRRHGGKSTTNLRSAARMYWGAFQMWRAIRNGTA